MSGYGDYTAPKLSNVARAVNTTYTNDGSPKLASYTVTLTVTATITGGQSTQMDAQIRPNAGVAWETVATSRSDMSFTVSLVTVSLKHIDDRSLTFFVPAGYQFRVVPSGTGTAVLKHAHEVAM